MQIQSGKNKNKFLLIKTISEIISGLKVLFMSGYTNNAIVDNEVLKSGIPFIRKPFFHEEFLNKIRDLLGREK